ncbi:NAD(P)/FAD-dependent oxidoreductase [Deinococcus malanensis]|uniref:NAD(P)/FAD-dependent oxidoreductase n=1 Tax=Deinococcus malanensis TaxID=1706855 RepID=UPI00362742F9
MTAGAGWDVAVIGAGIIGAACAWRLAERGLKVVVLEQGSPAGGSTGKSAAGVRAQFTSETNILLSKHSIEEYAAMPESGYHPGGYLLLVPEAQWPAHQAGVELQHRLGVPTEQLTPEDAQVHAEFLPDGLGGCTFCGTDGHVDAHGLTMAYVNRAREAGARFLLDTPVTGIRRDGEVWQLSTPAGRVEAPCWSTRVAPGPVRWVRWQGWRFLFSPRGEWSSPRDPSRWHGLCR